MPILSFVLAGALLAPALTTAQTAGPLATAVAADMKAKITPATLAAIQAQNIEHTALDAAGIKKLDNQWKSEISSANKPLIDLILKNTVSTELKRIQAESGGKYAEIFITDNRGLNVGQTGMTSDYWQGDEDKFTKVFPHVGAIHTSLPEFDESAQAFVTEVNGTIADGTTAIGTYTVMVITAEPE
jgi:hypothetical protein